MTAAVRRENPHLMLVTGNPPRSDVLEAWCRFHERDEFNGHWEKIPDIPGAPSAMFVLGRCAEIDVGDGLREFKGGVVWVACDPADESLWIVSRAAMNLNGLGDAEVRALVYDPPGSSGKEPALYKHDFSSPLPRLAPVGESHGRQGARTGPRTCRAALLDGGVYRVDEWIRN